MYARTSVCGQEGPLATTTGHDIGYIAHAGAPHALGRAGGPRQFPANLLGDFGGEMLMAYGGALATARFRTIVNRLSSARPLDPTEIPQVRAAAASPQDSHRHDGIPRHTTAHLLRWSRKPVTSLYADQAG